MAIQVDDSGSKIIVDKKILFGIFSIRFLDEWCEYLVAFFANLVGLRFATPRYFRPTSVFSPQPGEFTTAWRNSLVGIQNRMYYQSIIGA